MITRILSRILSAIPSPQLRVPAGNQSMLQFAFMVRKPWLRFGSVERPLVAAAVLSLSACASVKFDLPEGDTAKVAHVQGNPVIPSKDKTTAFVSFNPEAFPANQRGCLT